MNISGIRPVEGFYTYNTNRINEQRNLQIQDAKEPVQQVQPVEQQETAVEAARPQQSFDAYAYAQSYEPEATYELVGSDSNIHNLDVEKAISDMQKDQLLHQYQFFVGTQQSVSAAQTPNMLRQVENFTL